VCAAAVVALALTGCAATTDDTNEAAPAATKTTAAATTAATADAPISAEALCAHLKKDLPRIQAVGSAVGAQAQLAISIADLYDAHLDQLDGDVVDAQAAKSCPETRAALIKAAGLTSLGSL
jgi:hypothetical protein